MPALNETNARPLAPRTGAPGYGWRRETLVALRRWSGPRCLAILAIAAMLAGTLQNPLLTLLADVRVQHWNSSSELLWRVGEAPLVKYIDDVFVLLLVCASLLRIRHMARWPKYAVIVWGALCVASLVATLTLTRAVTADNAVLLARQVILPAALLLPGLALNGIEWRLISRWAIVIALANVAYACLELAQIRPFSPAVLAVLDGRWVDKTTGLPGNFLGWWVDGTQAIRLGGLLVNPPTFGVLCAVAAVLAWWSVTRRWWRFGIVVALSLATVAAISRGGLLILLAGLLFPYLVKFLGRWITIAIGLVICAGFAYLLLGHGKSGLHLDGLGGGLQDAIVSIFGRGFGYAGNFAEAAESKESLIGIAFSASGLLAVACVAALVVTLLRRTFRWEQPWLPLLALGGIAVAALAETAGSIYGTVPLWLATGYALQSRPELSGNDMTRWLAARGLWGKRLAELVEEKRK